ncbi:MAG: diacylglycerol/lipid kinase family protein [Candidatus Levyibacteriota bacterium]
MKNDIIYLINPKSNEGNSVRLWEKLQRSYSFLPEQPVDLTRIHLKSYLQERSPEVIAIAGGDGSINAVCDAVSGMQKKPLLTVIPFGFGNAISYCLGVETVEKAMDVLQKQPKTVTIDLLHTNIPKHSIGVFNMSAGFDARVVFNRQHHKYIGIRSYVLSAVQSLISHPEQEITITIDKTVTLTARATSLVIANCPVIGQNYIVSPAAKFNDGLLDCTLFSSKYAYITNLRFRGFKHPLYSELGKVRFKASHIQIEGEPYVQVDGDPIVHKGPLEIEILPAQVTFLRNEDEAINQMYLPFVSEK